MNFIGGRYTFSFVLKRFTVVVFEFDQEPSLDPKENGDRLIIVGFVSIPRLDVVT